MTVTSPSRSAHSHDDLETQVSGASHQHNVGHRSEAAEQRCSHCSARHFGLCDVFSDADINQLVHIATTEHLAPGETLVFENDPAKAFFNVTAGTLRVLNLLPDGRRQITGFPSIGHFLGLAVSSSCTVRPEPVCGHLRAVGYASVGHLLGLVTTPHYAFTAEAIDAVSVCRFSRAQLSPLLQKYPALEHHMVEIASGELAAAQEHMLLLGRKTARERLASFLVSLASAGQPPCAPPRSHLHLPMPRSDIADYLGLTIETVSRVFSRMKAERLIVLEGANVIHIQSAEALKALAQGND